MSSANTLSTTLGRDQCIALLSRAKFADLAMTHRALPVVVPVAITVVDDLVDIESLLNAFPLRTAHVVALAADSMSGGCDRWFVEVTGMLRESSGASSAKFAIAMDHVVGWRVPSMPELVSRH